MWKTIGKEKENKFEVENREEQSSEREQNGEGLKFIRTKSSPEQIQRQKLEVSIIVGVYFARSMSVN